MDGVKCPQPAWCFATPDQRSKNKGSKNEKATLGGAACQIQLKFVQAGLSCPQSLSLMYSLIFRRS